MSCIRDEAHSKAVRLERPKRAIRSAGVFPPQGFFDGANGLSRTIHVKSLESRSLMSDQLLASVILKEDS